MWALSFPFPLNKAKEKFTKRLTIIFVNAISDFIRLHNIGRTSPSVVFGNSNYSFHKEPPQYRNWEESRKRCKNIGSDLVSIESENEWIFLKETIQKNAIIEYFIGLKKERSGEWRWISDNSKVNGTRGNFPWAKEEPNGDGNCAVMYKEYREYYGLFNDLSCTENRMIPGYICESSVNSNDQEGMFYKLLFFLLGLLLNTMASAVRL